MSIRFRVMDLMLESQDPPNMTFVQVYRNMKFPPEGEAYNQRSTVALSPAPALSPSPLLLLAAAAAMLASSSSL